MATPKQEAAMLAQKFAENVDGQWAFRWKAFDISAASKGELLDKLAESIRQARERAGYQALPEPPIPTTEEVDALALSHGMQSPEFMEAAGARMHEELHRDREAKLGTAARRDSEPSPPQTPMDKKPLHLGLHSGPPPYTSEEAVRDQW